MPCDCDKILQQQLDQRADAKTKAWWERYLKHVIPFRGVKMADIRAVLHQWVREEGIDRLPVQEQKELALALIRLDTAEDKLAGVLFWQEILLPAGEVHWPDDLPRFAELFQQGYIYDWNTCDWFCVRVLGPWRTAEPLWQRRAAAVGFVNLARRGEANFPGFSEMLLGACAPLVASSERFAQTGAGWVLRELSLADQARVVSFVEERIGQFTREGLAYATEKMPVETQARLKTLHKATKQ